MSEALMSGGTVCKDLSLRFNRRCFNPRWEISREKTAMPRFHTIDDLDVAGKRVLLRADLNVPVKDGKVTDATRIERLAPTIEALIARNAKVVVMSHFGRPKGPDAENSLRQLVAPLSQAISGRTVHFATDCIGPEAATVIAALKPGEV